MSFATSFGLSLKNLFTKKGRTALVSFAGSIGIIGIALIYAVSHGMTSYIDAVQEDTLSSYPLTIEATHIDASSLITAFMGRESSGEEHGKDAVYQKAIMLDMLKALSSIEEQKNDLKAFKAYIEKELETEGSPLSEALSGVSYSYDADLLIYTKSSDGKIMRSDPGTLTSEMVRENMGMNVASGSQTGAFSAFSRSSASSSLWRELVPDRDGSPVSELTKKQYDIVYGRWPERYDEAVLFLDSKNEISDLSLYALGLKSEEETERIFNAAMNKEPFEYGQTSWSYETVCAGEYRVILSSDCYTPDAKTGN